MPQAAKEHGVHGVDVGGNELALSGALPCPKADCPRNDGNRHCNPPASAEERTHYGYCDYNYISAGTGGTVASKGNVEVITKPAAERHVPAAPEILCVGGLVRGVEVLGKVETHEHGNAGGDVRIAGEIGIHLQGVAEKGRQVLKAAVQERVLKHAVCEVHRHVIGQNELFEKAVHYPEDGNPEPPAAEVVGFVKLRYELRRSHNGACNQLREEAEVEAKVQEILHGLYPAALHVYYITHRLEGEEGYANGQDNGVYAEKGRARNGVQELPKDIMDLY